MWSYYNQEIMVGYLILLMGYINASIWWYVLAGVLINAGKIIDLRLAKEKIGRNWSHPFFVTAAGVLFWAGSTYILVISQALEAFPLGSGERFIALTVGGAILIAVLGAWISAKSVRKRRS